MMEYEKKIFAMQEANAIMGATIKLQESEIARLKAELAQSVKLPCKVGDTAYILGRNLLKGANAWYMEKITIAVVDMERSALGTDCYIQAECELIGGYLGATVFLTKEEAEKALAERRRE